MKRFPHYLRRCTGGRWPASILCVDVCGETYPSGHMAREVGESFVSWHAALLISRTPDYQVARTLCGMSREMFWLQLARVVDGLSPTWVISHGALRAWNLLGLWEELEHGRLILSERSGADAIRRCVVQEVRRCYSKPPAWPVSAGGVSRLLEMCGGYLVSGNPPSILRARFADSPHWFTWVDIRNYGVERPENLASGATATIWLAGAIRSISASLHAYKLGSLRTTAGSQSMHGFRCSYYSGGIYVGTRRQANALEHSGYYGGRCECRIIGTAGFSVIAGDFASQYARLCRDNCVPVRCTTSASAAKGKHNSPNCGGANAIADVDIETDEPAYPYRRVSTRPNASYELPAKGDAGHSWLDTDTIYPIGRFRTTLCGPELTDALQRNRAKRIHAWAEYELQPALREYATAILSMRAAAERTNDIVSVQLAKRLGNCLPGKFGERFKEWVYAPEAATDVQYGEWWAKGHNGEMALHRAIAGVVHRLEREQWSQDAVPAIAAWVTSLGRMVLLQAIRLAGWENVLYYDTDSVFTNIDGWDCLQCCAAWRHGVGPLLREVGRSENAEFLGIKHYRFGNKHVCAGVGRNSEPVVGDSWRYWRNVTPTEYIKDGKRPEQELVQVRGEHRQRYSHGVVGDDGKVSPIVVEEW